MGQKIRPAGAGCGGLVAVAGSVGGAVGQMLHQRAAEGHVDQLQAAADGQDRPLQAHRGAQ